MGLIRRIIKEIIRPFDNKIKGEVGESKVNLKLNPLLFGGVEHRLINNLLLIDENGKSHQIDHIEIRENGIFCIETKNIKGWIFGNENQKKWTQVLYNEKHKFINPIKQNKSHIYHISKVLNRKYKINSVVVMVQNNADRINCENVINLDDLKSYLLKYNDGSKISVKEMDEIYVKLMSASSSITDREHIRNIKLTQRELKQGLCPRCGGQLVERNGKYGKFWGCSNYPKCKFILKNK